MNAVSELKTDVAGTFHWRCIHKWHGIEKGRALNVEKVDFVVALILGWIEGANKWESTENAGFSHVINKKLESISLNKFKMRSKLRFSI